MKMKRWIWWALGAIGFAMVRSGTAAASNASTYIGESFLNMKGLPRGMKNNNPGNIKINPRNRWIGKVPEALNRDGTFEQFWTYRHGIRALIRLLKNYIANGNNTIRKVVNRYAPNSENPTSMYVDFVAAYMRRHPDQPLSADKYTLRSLVKAIARFENGREAITDTQFDQAWEIS